MSGQCYEVTYWPVAELEKVLDRWGEGDPGFNRDDHRIDASIEAEAFERIRGREAAFARAKELAPLSESGVAHVQRIRCHRVTGCCPGCWRCHRIGRVEEVTVDDAR